MAGLDREFKELLISVTTVIIGFWAIVQLTSGLIWDWNGWKALEPQSYPPCEVNNFFQFTPLSKVLEITRNSRNPKEP